MHKNIPEAAFLPVIVNGYVSITQHSLYPQIIPNEINDLCFKYYFELCKNPKVNFDRAQQLVKEGNLNEAYCEMARSFECEWKQSFLRYHKTLQLIKDKKIQEAYDEMRPTFQSNFHITKEQKYFLFPGRFVIFATNILIPLKKYEELESLISTLLRKDPNCAPLYRDVKANGLRSQNKMNEALKIAQTNTEKYPDNHFFWETQSNIWFDMGQYNKSKECILKAMELEPNRVNINVKYILLLRKCAKWKEIEEFTDKLMQTNPKNITYNHYKSEALQKQNKFDQALNVAEKNVQHHPDKYLSIFTYAQILFQMKQYEKCQKIRITNMKLAPNDKSLHYFYMEVLKKLNAFNELHSFCDELMRKDPNSAASYFACFQVCQWEKKMKDAIFLIKKAIALDPHNMIYISHYYRASFDMKQYHKSKECVQKLMETEPYNIDRKILYIDLLKKLQDWDALFAFYNERKINNVISQITKAIDQNTKKRVEYISKYSDILFDLKQYEKCGRNRKKAMELKPKNRNYKINYLQVLQIMNKWKEANILCDELIAEYPKSADCHYQSALNYVFQFDMVNALIQVQKAMKLARRNMYYVSEYAFFLNENNNNKLAKQIIEMQWKRKKKHYRLCYVYGVILKEEGKYKESETYLKAAVKQVNGSNILRCYGHLCFVQRKYKESAEYFEKSLNNFYPNSFTHYYHALSLCKLQQYDKAFKSFTESLKFRPNNPKCHYDLGVLLIEKMHRYKEGRMHIKKANELHPTNEKYCFINKIKIIKSNHVDVNGNFFL